MDLILNTLHMKGLITLKKNKQLQQINMDGITNLLLEYIKSTAVKDYTDEEERGIIKFIVYLIDKWEEETYVN